MNRSNRRILYGDRAIEVDAAELWFAWSIAGVFLGALFAVSLAL